MGLETKFPLIVDINLNDFRIQLQRNRAYFMFPYLICSIRFLLRTGNYNKKTLIEYSLNSS